MKENKDVNIINNNKENNNEKRNLRPRHEKFDNLNTEDESKNIYNEEFVLCIPNLPNITKIKKKNSKTPINIPIPSFEIFNNEIKSESIKSNKINKNSSDTIEEEQKIEDISDIAYNIRHRKYELAEKRLRNREKEILQHQLYKLKELEEQKRHFELNHLLPFHLEALLSKDEPKKEKHLNKKESEENKPVKESVVVLKEKKPKKENPYTQVVNDKYRYNSALDQLLSSRINPYPDSTNKLRRATRKLKAFGVILPFSIYYRKDFDDYMKTKTDEIIEIKKHHKRKALMKKKKKSKMSQL